jgi:hypothetical protein
MPMVDKFPAVLREELEIAFQENIDVFNVAQVCNPAKISFLFLTQNTTQPYQGPAKISKRSKDK